MQRLSWKESANIGVAKLKNKLGWNFLFNTFFLKFWDLVNILPVLNIPSITRAIYNHCKKNT